MQIYTELNNPGSGSISVQRYDPSAIGLTIGKLVKVDYRGQPRSGFFIENIGADEVKSGERAAEWIKLAGRGAMTVLEDALVYPRVAYPAESTRSFTNVTMASMLLTFINEARARGCFPSMRTEFSATLDSNGDPWTDVSTLTFNVDTTLLDVVGQLVDLGLEFNFAIDWTLADYVLYAYQTAIGSDKSADVVFRPGLNCEDAGSNQESGELKNVLHISYQGGFVELADAGSQASYRRREAPFQAGNAITSAAAIALARPQLTAKKDPTLSITVKLADAAAGGPGGAGAGSPRAFVDYNLGDWVGYDNGSGAAPVSYRVRGMMLDWSDTKYATVTVDLNSVKLERELKNAIALRKLGNGVIGSSTSSPMPAGVAAAINVHNIDNTAHGTRTLSGGDLAGSLGLPVVAALRGVALKNPLTMADRKTLVYNLANLEFEPAYVQWSEVENKPTIPSTYVLPTATGAVLGGVKIGSRLTMTGDVLSADVIKLDDLAAPDDNTDLDASTSKHGLLKKLSGVLSEFLNGDGDFATPASEGGGGLIDKVVLPTDQVVTTLADITDLTLTFTPVASGYYQFLSLLCGSKTDTGSLTHEITDASNAVLSDAVISVANGFMFQSSCELIEYLPIGVEVTRKIRCSVDSGSVNLVAALNNMFYAVSLADAQSGSGDVVGPAGATTNHVVFFDGVTGKLIKDSGLTLSGSNTGDQTLPVKATGAEINTGTDDAKFATSKAIADSKLVVTDKVQTLSGKTLTAPIVAILKPAADSTTAVKITKADGVTPVVTVDTTNGKMTIPSGGIDATNGNVRSLTPTIVDDGAMSFTPSRNSGFLFIAHVGTSGIYAIVAYNTATPTTTICVGHVSLEVTTGVLTGTTGTDVKMTVSCHTDGKIYVENRIGATRTFAVLVI